MINIEKILTKRHSRVYHSNDFINLHKHEPDWSPVKVSGQDPVYLPPTHTEKHELLYSPDTVSILVVRHPLIRLVSAWNEKFHKDYKYGYSMFRREHNLRFYAKQNATDHWISNGLKFFKSKFKLSFFLRLVRKELLKAFMTLLGGLLSIRIRIRTSIFGHNLICALLAEQNLATLLKAVLKVVKKSKS